MILNKMALEHIIKTQEISNNFSRHINEFEHLFQLIGLRVEHSTKREKIRPLVKEYFQLLIGTYYSVEKKVKDNDLIGNVLGREDISSIYCMYIASKLIGSNLDLRLGPNGKNQHQISRDIRNRRLIKTGLKDEYSNFDIALSSLFDYINRSRNPTQRDVRDFNREYQKQAVICLKNIANEEVFNSLKEIKWNIDGQKIYGIEVPKEVNLVQNDSIKKAQHKEVEMFETPLEYMRIDKKKVMPKEQIIGDIKVIEELEKSVRQLLSYNTTHKRNLFKELGLFNNKHLLQGLPGTGKTRVALYLIDYAERLNVRYGGDLMISALNINSSWKDGDIQKLQSQFNQICYENKTFFIFEDEIDALLKDGPQSKEDRGQVRIKKEFNKFLEGAYPDNGNYLFLTTLNRLENLTQDNRERFSCHNWKGAVTAEEKGLLIKYKLNEGYAGNVNLSDRDLKKLGNLTYQSNLGGRDIAKVCLGIKQESFDDSEEIFDLLKRNESSLESQKEIIISNIQEINYSNLKSRFEDYILNRENVIQDSKIYSGDKNG